MYNDTLFIILQAQNAQNYDKVYAKILHETYHKNFDKAITAGDSYTKVLLNLFFRLRVLCCWQLYISEKEM